MMRLECMDFHRYKALTFSAGEQYEVSEEIGTHLLGDFPQRFKLVEASLSFRRKLFGLRAKRARPLHIHRPQKLPATPPNCPPISRVDLSAVAQQAGGQHTRVHAQLRTLNVRERYCLFRKFSLDAAPTYAQLGTEVGVSTTRARQLVRQALRKLG